MDPKDEIKQKIEISELIGEYLDLKPAGTRGFKAVCPFHFEKTPSFHVSNDRQVWHCFGCGEGGDCFSFVMKMEGMDFPEALLHLGQKVGVEVKRFSSTDSQVKQRLLAINTLASKYFQKVLEQSSQAQLTRSYVQERGISLELMQKFGLGFALGDWSALSDVLLKHDYRESEIVSAGLAQKKHSGSGIIDRFRERLMIPLRDQHGNTVGFTGRILPFSKKDPGFSPPKYMNSPETPLYHKGELLFGLDVAKRAIKEYDSVIIVEGNLDVIASHKAGVEQVVASSGTALTESQLRLLARYTKKLIFAFDQDAAGFTAAKRGISLARGLGFDVRAILLPVDVKDPDELVQKDPKSWQEIALHSVPIMEFFIARLLEGKDLTNVDHKRQISQELLPMLREIQDVVEQQHWINVVSGILGVDVARLRSAIGSPAVEVSTVDQQHVLSGLSEAPKIKKTKKIQVYKLLIGLFINQPDECTGHFFTIPFPDEQYPLLRDLYILCKNLYDSARNVPNKSFFSRLRDEIERAHRDDLLHLLDETSLLAEKTFSFMSESEVRQQMNNLSKLIVHESAQQARKEIAQKLRTAELTGDKEAIDLLLTQLTNLS